MLEQLGATWDGTRAKLRAWNEALTQWTSRVEQERSRLAGLRESWVRSREAAASAGAPKVVLDQIDGILGGINAARTRVETRLSAPLVAQYRLAQLQRRADEAVARVAQARTDRLRRLGERDGPPLWGRGLWAGAMSQAAAAAHDVRAAGQAVIAEVAQQHGTRVPLHALLFLILVTLLWRGRRAARRWTKDDPSTGSVIGVFNRPISSALVLACFVAPWIYTDARPVLLRVVALVAIVPVGRLIRPSLDRSVAAALYVFGALFVVDALRSVIVRGPLFEHMIFLGEMLVASAATLWVRIARRRQAARAPRGGRDGGGRPAVRRPAPPHRVRGRVRPRWARLHRARPAGRGGGAGQRVLRTRDPGRGAGGEGAGRPDAPEPAARAPRVRHPGPGGARAPARAGAALARRAGLDRGHAQRAHAAARVSRRR